MDYNKILEDAQNELTTKKERKAVLDQQINDLATQLGLDKNQPLLPQVEELKAKLEEERAQKEQQITDLQEKLKEC